MRGRTAEIRVELENRQAKPPVRWHDTLILTQEGTSWRVADIRFNGRWQFKSGGSLRSVLKSE